jgi:hypothetical protein
VETVQVVQVPVVKAAVAEVTDSMAAAAEVA